MVGLEGHVIAGHCGGEGCGSRCLMIRIVLLVDNICVVPVCHLYLNNWKGLANIIRL